MWTLKASSQGLKLIKSAREQKGLPIEHSWWLVEASKVIEPDWNEVSEKYADGISFSSFKRFLSGKEPIKLRTFQAFSKILGLNWEEIYEKNQVVKNPLMSVNSVDRRFFKKGVESGKH